MPTDMQPTNGTMVNTNMGMSNGNLGAPAPGALSSMQGTASNMPPSTQPAGITGGAIPGQQLNYGNVLYNANNANQNAINGLQNAQGLNQNTLNSLISPYLNTVSQNAAALTNQQFQNTTLPALQSNFGMNGDAGSARAMNSINFANNLNNQTIAQQQGTLLNQGFQQAMQNYQGLQSNAINANNALGQQGVNASNIATQEATTPSTINAINSGALSALGSTTPVQSQTMSGVGTNYIS